MPKRKSRKRSPVKALDRLFSLIVRSVGRCENCGATDRLQCAHGFSRRYRNVRWDVDNAFCLCAGCHMFYTYRPLEWDEWLLERWGEDLYDTLRVAALDTSRKVDLDAVKEDLDSRWSELQTTA